ncbi:hypothetical protein BJQ90_01786 [Arthrobacter sp. SO3]|nr:hypothetical protein [Arthrobacter sp. SO3]
MSFWQVQLIRRTAGRGIRAASLLVALCLVLSNLTACTSEPGAESSVSGAQPASDGTLANPSQMTTTDPASAGAGQAASGPVDPRGGAVLCSEASGTVTISQYRSGMPSPVPVATFSPSKVMSGWSVEGACQTPLRWTPNFSLYLAAGRPPGEASMHVAVVDVTRGTYTDVTSSRPEVIPSGTSEDNPTFVSDNPTDKVTFGSHVVLIQQATAAGELKSVYVDLRSPQQSTPGPSITQAMLGQVPGHPEMVLATPGLGRVYNLVSPGGAYVADGGKIRPAGSPANSGWTAKCLDQYMGAVLGWADSSHVVFTDGHKADLVTAEPNPVCSPISPPGTTAETSKHVWLSEDGSTFYYTSLTGVGDYRDYSIPVHNPGAGPQPAEVPASVLASDDPASGVVTYARGNF